MSSGLFFRSQRMFAPNFLVRIFLNGVPNLNADLEDSGFGTLVQLWTSWDSDGLHNGDHQKWFFEGAYFLVSGMLEY